MKICEIHITQLQPNIFRIFYEYDGIKRTVYPISFTGMLDFLRHSNIPQEGCNFTIDTYEEIIFKELVELEYNKLIFTINKHNDILSMLVESQKG